MGDSGIDYWAFFEAEARKMGSPLYARLSECIRGDEEIRTLAARARKGQPHANVLFAAVHFLLLRGADHPLKRHYADLGGGAGEGEDPFPPFRDFVATHRAQIGRLIETRVTNTNEIGRSAVLHPGFRALAQEAGSPLELIEIGPSAGLNMIWDRYGVRYLRDGAVAAQIAPDAPLVIACEAHSPHLPPAGPAPAVRSRLGLELNPVDLSDSEDRDWLRALVWPDQVPRLARLDEAIGLFARDRPAIRHGDALALLPDALAEVAGEGAICVYHTIAIYQFSTAMKEALEDILTVAGLRRPVWRLSFEWDGRDSTLSRIRYRDGTRDDRPLARAHPHGAWIEWYA